MPDLEATKERLARACRVAGKLNLADEAGHISVRLPGGYTSATRTHRRSRAETSIASVICSTL